MARRTSSLASLRASLRAAFLAGSAFALVACGGGGGGDNGGSGSSGSSTSSGSGSTSSGSSTSSSGSSSSGSTSSTSSSSGGTSTSSSSGSTSSSGGTTSSSSGGAIPPVVSGVISFDFVPHNANSGLNYAGTSQRPARAVTVQVIRASDGGVIGSATTDASGAYALQVPAATGMFLRVRAEMLRTGTPAWNFTVVDNTATNALYTLTGSTFDSGTASSTRNLNAPSGFNAAGSVTGPRSAGPFAILDSIYQAYNKVLSADGNTVFPKLVTSWSPNNTNTRGTAGGVCPTDGRIGTSYFSTADTDNNPGTEDRNICLLGRVNVDTDEYDDHVVIHEWGHYFENALSRSDSIGGNHGQADRLDLRVAFGEGFGNAWSGIVTDDPLYQDSNGTQQATGFVINVENNSNSNPGWYSEGSVQSILYDLYDANADGADSITLGVAPILAVLRGPQRTGTPLTSIFSFVSYLKAANAGAAGAISTLVNAQSIVGSTIDVYGTTETNNAGSADVLPVYTDLTLGGGSRTACTTNAFGGANKLSVRRFFKFNVPTTRTVTITATGGTDPDFVLFRTGELDSGQGSAAGSETLRRNLDAGDYVVEAYEFDNADTSSGVGRVCLAVSVS